jgi:hypothetical protein
MLLLLLLVRSMVLVQLSTWKGARCRAPCPPSHAGVLQCLQGSRCSSCCCAQDAVDAHTTKAHATHMMQ